MPSARPVISHPARPPRHHTPPTARKVTKRRSLYDCSSSSDESPRPALKRVSCCTAGITSSNPEMKMRAPISTMDAIDFDNLPPAVRRKVGLDCRFIYPSPCIVSRQKIACSVRPFLQNLILQLFYLVLFVARETSICPAAT